MLDPLALFLFHGILETTSCTKVSCFFLPQYAGHVRRYGAKRHFWFFAREAVLSLYFWVEITIKGQQGWVVLVMLLLTKLPNFYILFQTREKQARTKSAEFLKKELEKEENLGCTEYLTKVRSSVWFSYLFLFLFGKISTKSKSLFSKYHIELRSAFPFFCVLYYPVLFTLS